jgi:hypothetical protein
MPDFGSRLPLNKLSTWQPGCWCVAMIRLCEAHTLANAGGPVQYPEQWVYFLWAPRDEAKPFALPVGWGVTRDPPYAEIYAEVGREPVLMLAPADIDLVSVLEWLQALDNPPGWLRSLIATKLELARICRLVAMRTAIVGEQSVGFARFLERLLEGAAHS